MDLEYKIYIKRSENEIELSKIVLELSLKTIKRLSWSIK